MSLNGQLNFPVDILITIFNRAFDFSRWNCEIKYLNRYFYYFYDCYKPRVRICLMLGTRNFASQIIKYLDSSLIPITSESVSQTFKHSPKFIPLFDSIVVTDRSSTDFTLKLIQEWCNKYAVELRVYTSEVDLTSFSTFTRFENEVINNAKNAFLNSSYFYLGDLWDKFRINNGFDKEKMIDDVYNCYIHGNNFTYLTTAFISSKIINSCKKHGFPSSWVGLPEQRGISVLREIEFISE